jgi:nucleotide-binding universal stress UspA family protein
MRQGSNVTYVVGFIETPEGWAGVRYAAAEAKKNGARLVIVNSMRGGRHDDQEDYQEIREAVDKLTAMLTTDGVEYEIAEYVRGNTPARDLIEAADKHEAELIVIGIRRRSATGKALLGSNALDILHDANVPVVCVKADLSDG